jgi:hypothetical protein
MWAANLPRGDEDQSFEVNGGVGGWLMMCASQKVGMGFTSFAVVGGAVGGNWGRRRLGRE